MQLSVFFINNLVYILWRLVADYITIVVTIAWRIHLFSFRTQKLSFSAPKVLVGWLTGRIGRCHIPFNTALCGVFYCEIYIINSAILSESLACFCSEHRSQASARRKYLQGLSPKVQIKPTSSEISSAFWFRKRPRNTYSMPSGVFLCIIRNLFRLPPIFSILSASYREDRSLPHSIQALLCRGAFLCHRKPCDSRVVQKRLNVDLYFIFWDCRVIYNAAFLLYELKYPTLGVWYYFSYYIQNA